MIPMPTPKKRLENLAKLQQELLATKREAEELSLHITQMLQEAAEEKVRLSRQVTDTSDAAADRGAPNDASGARKNPDSTTKNRRQR